MSTWKARLALAVILLLGLLIRVWGLDFGLPNLSRPDEELVSGEAVQMVKSFTEGRVQLPAGAKAGYTLVVALAYGAYLSCGSLFGFASPTRFLDGYLDNMSVAHMIARWLSALAGTATIWVVFQLALSVLSSRLLALLSALLMSVVYLHVRDSHFGVTDITGTLAVTLCVWLSCAYIRSIRQSQLNLAGLAAGAAGSFKIPDGLVIAAALAAHELGEQRLRLLKATDGNRGHAYLRGLVQCALFALIGFALFCPSVVVSPETFLNDVQHHLSYEFGIDVPVAWIYYLEFSLWWGLGPLCLAMGFVGAILAARELFAASTFRHQVWGPPLTFLVVYYAVMGSPQEAPVRFVLPMVPILVVLAVFALARISRMKRLRRLRAAVLFLGFCAIVYYPLAQSLTVDYLFAQTDTRSLAQKWLIERIKPGDAVGVGLQFADVDLPRGYKKYFCAGKLYGQPVQVLEAPNLRNNYVISTYADARALKSQGIRYIVVPLPLVAGWAMSPEEVRAIARQYKLVARFVPWRENPPDARAFDQLDAFCLPLCQLERMMRPGPEILIYDVSAKAS